ncbi:hypothetical protein PI126_g13543 [Phytophthora idaei]|nr:hypothetical protein PI126_g13543 [Phytophthora idaei]
MWAAFLSRYQEVLQEGELRQMCGPTYAFALWNVVFAVPVRVLDSRAEDFGRYGEMARTWWFALHATLCVYVPDLLIRTSASTAKYYDASLDATAATWARFCEGVRLVLWGLYLTVALGIHTPMAAYDLLEFVLQGGFGVAVVMLVLNLLNSYLEWTEYGLGISGCVFVIGLGTHVWRLGDLDGRLEKLSPGSVLTDARASVKSSAKARKHQEGTSLRRLR